MLRSRDCRKTNTETLQWLKVHGCYFILNHNAKIQIQSLSTGTGVSPNRYTSTNGYGSDQIDQMRSTGSTRRYDPATRYPYSGKSYTLPEKNASIR